MLTPEEKHELATLELKRKNQGLSLSESGRFDWLKFGKEAKARKELRKETSN